MILPFQQRVCDEALELQTRVTKLEDFIKTEYFQSLDDHTKTLMRRQFQAMITYLEILKERINTFGSI